MIKLKNMNQGKRICEHLKGIRRMIADEYGIPLEQEECTFEGECTGTCPRCEAELRYLEDELARRKMDGKEPLFDKGKKHPRYEPFSALSSKSKFQKIVLCGVAPKSNPDDGFSKRLSEFMKKHFLALVESWKY